MKMMLWIHLLVMGLILSYGIVNAEDSFYVIPVKKCCTCKGNLVGTRWCDNGDGTVTDMTTCLVWLKYADWGGRLPWRSNTSGDYDDAHAKAGLLRQGTQISGYITPEFLNDGSGIGDWRLPTRAELLEIRYGNESVSSTDMRAFKYIQGDYSYWSSSTDENNTFAAWYVKFSGHAVYYQTKTCDLYVWPVRNPK